MAVFFVIVDLIRHGKHGNKRGTEATTSATIFSLKSAHTFSHVTRHPRHNYVNISLKINHIFLPAAKRLGHAELRVEKKGTYGFLDMLTSVLVVFGIFLQYVEIF